MKNNDRRFAIIIGILFIIATTFFIVGKLIYEPILTSADYLKNASPKRSIVMLGIFIELIGIFAIIFIPVFIFPIIKKYNKTLAVGYICLRVVELESVYFYTKGLKSAGRSRKFLLSRP